MECKFRINELYEECKYELIDTLWNVNKIKEKMELDVQVRINRYIMECKSFRDSDILYCHLRINRYIMECKSAL